MRICNSVCDCFNSICSGCIIYSRKRVRWRGKGQWSPYAFRNGDYDALHFHTGSTKINLLKYSFWREREGVKKKECSVYAFDNVDNYGRPG